MNYFNALPNYELTIFRNEDFVLEPMKVEFTREEWIKLWSVSYATIRPVVEANALGITLSLLSTNTVLKALPCSFKTSSTKSPHVALRNWARALCSTTEALN